jgi:cyclophilin family peptidyl-prolyl cis-trans isomerase/HEAT repeat protein
MSARAMVAALLGLAALPVRLAAQSDANVEVLARILAAEDARRFDEALFRRALADPDSSVRLEAALGLGRLREPRGIPLLTPLLLDPDSLVQTTAIFALGLIGDSSAVPVLIGRARDPGPMSASAALELLTALARLGGQEAAGFLGMVLDGSFWDTRDDAVYLAQRAALESWRLGSNAPMASLLALVRAPKEDTRTAAIFSLGRLKVKAAGVQLVDAVGDQSPNVRATAVRVLSRAYADSAGLEPAAMGELLARAANDQDPGVGILALRSLGSYHEPALAAKIVSLLDDPVPNVEVQAAMTLGDLGGTTAVPALSRIAGGTKGSFARRREALLSLARLDTTAFVAQAGRWATAADWRERAAAAEGWARVRPGALAPFLKDGDSRVVAAALEAWGERVSGPDAEYLAACRQLARHRDAAVRTGAADGIARAHSQGDIPLLVDMYKRAARDSFPDGALSALAGLLAIAKAAGESQSEVENAALSQVPPPEQYVIRRWAEENWPAAAERWGSAYPLETGRTMDDYREVVRGLQTALDKDRYPSVRVEVDQLGVFEIQLYGAEAPLTVANFLLLTDRHYFDGLRFHRVVPNFVVQTGDPRGDGWGGPGVTLRDEINRRRYGAYYVGMALSGPDTGGSQWFATLSPQPQLDGAYTLFGRVTDGIPVLLRITEGDRIRSIRR